MKTQLRLFALTCFVFLLVGQPASGELQDFSHTAQLISDQLQESLFSEAPMQLAYFPYYDDDDDQAYNHREGKRITCESRGERATYCRTHIHDRIRLERQLSDAPCRPYETWGADG